MEKKEPIKISLPIFMAIIILLVAIVYGAFMYIQNEKLEKEIANLREGMSQTQVGKDELQDKQTSFSNISNSDNENSSDESDYTLTQEDKRYIENAIKKFYILLGKQETDSASMLEELGFTVEAVQDPDYYAPEGYVEYPNGEYEWTGIKYNDYTNTMKSYVGENILNEYFKDFVNYNGLLYMERKNGTRG